MFRRLSMISVLALAGPALADMTKTVNVDAPCVLDAQWTFDPEVVPDSGVHSGPVTNWEVSILIDWSPAGVATLYAQILHKEKKCHPADGPGLVDTIQFAMPDKNKTVRQGKILTHPAGAETHVDAYVVEFRRGVLPAGNRVRVWGWHIDLTPDILSYGVPKPNSLGCMPRIDSYGVPSASATIPFGVTASQVLNQKPGILIYGLASAQIPFQGGFLWVKPPFTRTPFQNSDGNPLPDDCSGTFDFEFNEMVITGIDPTLVPGTKVYTQYWSRDPLDPWTSSLSDALQFTILP